MFDYVTLTHCGCCLEIPLKYLIETGVTIRTAITDMLVCFADDDLYCVPDSRDSDFDSDNYVNCPHLNKFLKHVKCK